MSRNRPTRKAPDHAGQFRLNFQPRAGCASAFANARRAGTTACLGSRSRIPESCHSSSCLLFQISTCMAEQLCTRRLGRRRAFGGLEEGVLRSRGGRRGRLLGMAARHPRQVAAQYINGERAGHKERSDPEAPVAVHPSPVRARIGLAVVAAVSFRIVLVSSHLFSVDRWHSLRRASRDSSGAAAGLAGVRRIPSRRERSSGCAPFL